MDPLAPGHRTLPGKNSLNKKDPGFLAEDERSGAEKKGGNKNQQQKMQVVFFL